MIVVSVGIKVLRPWEMSVISVKTKKEGGYNPHYMLIENDSQMLWKK